MSFLAVLRLLKDLKTKIVWVCPSICFIIPILSGLDNRKPVLVMVSLRRTEVQRCLMSSTPRHTLVCTLMSLCRSLRTTLCPLKAMYWLIPFSDKTMISPRLDYCILICLLLGQLISLFFPCVSVAGSGWCIPSATTLYVILHGKCFLQTHHTHTHTHALLWINCDSSQSGVIISWLLSNYRGLIGSSYCFYGSSSSFVMKFHQRQKQGSVTVTATSVHGSV